MKINRINSNIKTYLFILLIIFLFKRFKSQSVNDLKKMEYDGKNNEKKIEMSGASFLTKYTFPEINKEFSLYSLNSKWYILSLHDSYFYSNHQRKEIIAAPISKIYDLGYTETTSFLLSNGVTRFQLQKNII